jgi:hypothetical protein
VEDVMGKEEKGAERGEGRKGREQGDRDKVGR